MNLNYGGQVLQDKFVAHVTGFKRGGFFLEIGSNDAVYINNSYALESQLGWRGVLVEFDSRYAAGYRSRRPASTAVIGDAQVLDYVSILAGAVAPADSDYLQVDLEENDGSTLNTLLRLEATVFPSYRFAAVTFEHDHWNTTGVWNTRAASRDVFARHGYVPVFLDVHDAAHGTPARAYEDWYVHPDLVDMTYVRELQRLNEARYTPHPATGRSIGGVDLTYPTK